MKNLKNVVIYSFSSFLSVAFFQVNSYAANLINADANSTNVRLANGRDGSLYRIRLEPFFVTPIPSGSLPPALKNQLTTSFPNWNFLNATAPAAGQLRIVKYDAHVNKLPSPFTVQYIPDPLNLGIPAPAGILNWIQFVDTNRPAVAGLPRPYLDPQVNPPRAGGDDDLPFYWTEPERILNSNLANGVRLQFTDTPSRALVQSPIDWKANLYLASWNGIANPVPDGSGGFSAVPIVTIFDGVTWGFKIRCIGAGVNGLAVNGGAGGDKIPFEEGGVVDPNSPVGCSIPDYDYGDAPESYKTLRPDGPRYVEGDLQRLGALWDSETNGQPSLNADGDDLSILGGNPTPQDDEDGVIFGDSWVDVTFNIARAGSSDYQLRAWWDTNYNEVFDHTSELYIDDLLTLSPGVSTKRYNLTFNPRAYYSRFRLTWDPLDLDVKPFGEFYSKSDCDSANAASGLCISHGEVEDYAPVPGPLPILGLGAAFSYVRRLRHLSKSLKANKL
jgi:hypothetical protein